MVILKVEKGIARLMIVKVFKVSTAEMWTFANKQALRQYVVSNILCVPKKNATINELIRYLPVEDYCRVR